MPALTGVSHVVLTVSDLDRSIPWYESVLGAGTLFRGRSAEGGFEVAYLAEPSGILLGLTRHDASDGTFSPRTNGLDHLSFAVADRAQLEQWAEHLDRNGVAHNG